MSLLSDEDFRVRRSGADVRRDTGARADGASGAGGLVSQLWPLSDQGGDPEIDLLTIQPFVNYNLGHGWVLVSTLTTRSPLSGPSVSATFPVAECAAA